MEKEDDEEIMHRLRKKGPTLKTKSIKGFGFKRAASMMLRKNFIHC